MNAVLIALADVGAAVQLEESLTKLGYAVHWDAAHEDQASRTQAAVVIVSADELGARLAEVADAWRSLPHLPGVVAIGNSEARPHALRARVTLLSVDATAATLRAVIDEAVRLRLSSRMSLPLARRALELPTGRADAEEVGNILARARVMDVELPRAALRWYATMYATDIGGIAALRHARILDVPEIEFSAHLDGTQTVHSVIRGGPLDGHAAARLLWALVSVGAVTLTAEPRDLATHKRRALAAIRDHLRVRMERLERSTFYDVLECTPLASDEELTRSYHLLASRYSPKLLAIHDLSELAVHVQPIWDLIEKAHSVLLDLPARGRYHDWLRERLPELRTSWALQDNPIKSSAEAFARGQQSLADGDVHRAMSEFATACRFHPGHPEYETNLAWARYRVQVAAGKDREVVAREERSRAVAAVLGTKPWPRAQLALALLCAADGDIEAARFQLHNALAADPGLVAAHQLLQRLAT